MNEFKPIKDQVYNQIFNRVSYADYAQILNPSDQVWMHVWIQVSDKIWDKLYDERI